MNKYLSRVLKIFVFIFLLVILDQVIGNILRKYYFTQTSGPNYILTNTFRECNADILIFGSSRAMYHYDPRLIRDSLKMSCYNVGQPGAASILLPYALFKVMTKRYTPKIIILEYNADINGGARGYDRLSVLLPYYKDYPELDPIISVRSPYEKFKLMSAIYPFNSNIVYIVRYNTNAFVERKDIDGFYPAKSKIPNMEVLEKLIKADQEYNMKAKYDSNVVIALKYVIDWSKEKNISLFIVNSPVFHMENESQIPTSQASQQAVDYIKKSNVNYFDFSSDSTFQGHMEWFFDHIHLNEDGAKVFTNVIIDTLKKYYSPRSE